MVKRAVRGGVRFSGLAVTYSPASWDAVPSAQRRLTAEFGMGSGVSLALMPPNLQSARAVDLAVRLFRATRLSFQGHCYRVDDLCRAGGAVSRRVRLLPDRIEPFGRLVPVS